MGLFKKKDKQVDDNQPVKAPEQNTVPAKKSKNHMSSVLYESVPEKSLEMLRQNKAFATYRYGQPVYVGLLLRAVDIGGLSKKHNKDESKGSLVEAINSGRITAIITPDLMAAEEMIIIPNAVTIDNMGEYGLLTQAPYTFAYVDDNLNIEKTNHQISYDIVEACVENDATVDELFDQLNITFDDTNASSGQSSTYDNSADDMPVNQGFGGFPTDMFADDDDDEPAPSIPTHYEDVYSQNIPDDMSEEEPEDYETNDVPSYDEVPEESDEAEYDVSGEPEAPVEEYDFDTDGDYEDEDDAGITEEMFEQAVVRRFYSDDLGLEVSTEAFDAQFLHMNSYIPFDENRGDGWINQYLNEISKQANTEIKRLHAENLFKIRSTFMTLCAMHCESIHDKLDIEKVGTTYFTLVTKLGEEIEHRQQSVDSIIAERKAAMEKEWDEKLIQIGEDAANAARQEYESRFGRQHQDAIYKIEPTIRGQIDDEYQDALKSIYDRRRREGASLLDMGVTEILKDCTNDYAKCLAEEKELETKYSHQIMEFIDSHREDDIARTKALQAELERTNESKRIQEECDAKIKQLSSEFDAKRVAMQEDLDKAKRDNDAYIRRLEQDAEARINNVKSELENARLENEKLRQQVVEAKTVAKEECDAYIKTVENQRDAAYSQCEHIENTHKKNNSLILIVAIIAVIAFTAIGALVGLSVNVNLTSDRASNAVVSEVQSYMDDMYGKTPTEPASDNVTDEEKAETTTQNSAVDKNDETTTADKNVAGTLDNR